MRRDFWAIVWLCISVGIFIAANIYTNSPVLDVTFAHIVIAGIVGFFVSSICFVVFECIAFMVNLAKRVAARAR